MSLNGVSNVNEVSKTNSSSSTKSAKDNKNETIILIRKSNLTNEQKIAVESFKKHVEQGHIDYHKTGFWENFLNIMMDNKSGDYIRITNFAKPGEKLSFGEAKYILKFNLPPGSLLCNKTESGGGDFDQYSVPTHANGEHYLDIFLDDLTEGLGLTKEEIKVLCNFQE